MCRSVSMLRRHLIYAISATVMVCAVAQRAQGQVLRSAAPTSTFDAYNNVRPPYEERRTIGSFQNETQRTALRGFQTQNRRENRRGGSAPFSLLGDRLAALRAGTGSTQALLSVGRAFSPSRAGAFSRFGRSERDSAVMPSGTAAAAVARRRLLLSGASRNEPIYRALQLAGGRGTQTHRIIATTPFVSADRESPPLDGAETNLHDFLRVKADLERSRVRNEAWERFRDGEYLSAAQVFDTVTTLDVSDQASRIGEMFCHVILHADRTALVVFQKLVRHDENLFEGTLGGSGAPDATAVFGDPQRVLRLRADALVRADQSQANPDTRAMYLLVLWYLGETSEAQRGAVSLAREYPTSPYAGWPDKMQRVLNRDGSGS